MKDEQSGDFELEKQENPEKIDHPNRRKVLFLLGAGLLFSMYPFSRIPKILAEFKSRKIDLGDFSGGYVTKKAVESGTDIQFLYHSHHELDVDLVRLGLQKEIVKSFTVPAVKQDGSYDPYRGFNWNNPYRISTKGLKGGYYFLHIQSSGNESIVPFIIQSNKNVGMTLVASTNTWDAYNSYVCGNYGGDAYPVYDPPSNKWLRSIDKRLAWVVNQFGYASSIPQYRAPLPLPQNRPISWSGEVLRIKDPTQPMGIHLLGAEWALVHLLEKNMIPYRVITDRAFHNSYEPQDKEVTIFHAHSEYWSEGMKNNLEKFYNRGRAFLFLSGNSIYRDVEFYRHGVQVVSQESDRDRSESLTGSFYDQKGYLSWSDFKIMKREHWVFDGLPANVDSFGKVETNPEFGGASGFETDKQSDRSNATLLAKGNNPENGGADMVIMENENGGVMFNAGSVSFTSCLAHDSTMKLVLKNLLAHAGNPVAALK